ncbi:hypothetical protein [Brucella intermedia]|uniref:hypothetical protein n=1 Tax=Brucella intermedia TaxID=94625 RepID=UPI002362FB40|nr:hypothetical protein [Brucella intermedia]
MTDEQQQEATQSPEAAEMQGRIRISPVAAVREAENLNAYYQNRNIILANEIVQLQGALEQAAKDRDAAEQKHKEEIARMNKDRDQLMRDLEAARGITAKTPIASTTAITAPKLNKVK